MRDIRLKAIVLNCGGVGEKLDRSIRLLKLISGAEPIKTTSTRRIPGFGVRPGLEVGCKVTISEPKATALLKRLLESINFEASEKQFGNGTFTFGIEEYLTIPGFQFQRDIGIMGLDVAVNLTRAGLSVDKKKIKRGKIPLRHKITREETIKFMQENFNIKLKEKREEKRRRI